MVGWSLVYFFVLAACISALLRNTATCKMDLEVGDDVILLGSLLDGLLLSRLVSGVAVGAIAKAATVIVSWLISVTDQQRLFLIEIPITYRQQPFEKRLLV